MGLARDKKGRKANLTQRLRLLAEDLEPAKAPRYVAHPGGRTPSQGWWWIPKGHQYPVLLGHNHIVAETQLRHLLEALERAT
jgi:hypothetical protein